MLKLLSSTSSRVHCLTTPTPSLRIKQEPNSLFYALGRLIGLTQRSPKNSFFRACFCSDSSDGSGSGSGSQPAVEVDEKGAESQSGSDSKASSAIVSTYPKPEDYLTVGFGNYESFFGRSLFSSTVSGKKFFFPIFFYKFVAVKNYEIF